MKKGKKQSASSRSETEAAHLDNLLDEALWETFPASDPIAITIDKPSKGVAPHGRLDPGSPSMTAESQEVSGD